MKFISSITSFLKKNCKTSYLILIVLFVGIILRVYGLSEQKYWYDEFVTLMVSKEKTLGSIITGGRPPLYLIFSHFWIEYLGTSESVTRLLPIIFGVSSIVLIYMVGKSLFNREVGILSAFFMSVSRFQIYYSQELRYYSLYELLTLISFFCYLRLLNSKRHIYTVAYIFSTILLYYSHDIGLLIIVVQNLYVIIKYKSLRSIIAKWFLSQVVIFISIAPRFIPSFSGKALGESGPNWISPPNIMSPWHTINDYMGIIPKIHNSIVFDIAIIFLLTGTVIYLLIIGKQKWIKSLNQFIAAFKSSWNMKSETILVMLWLFVPIALVLLMSEVFKPMYLSRYLICSAPACYILVALFLTKVKKVIPIGIMLITYAFLISPGLYEYYTKPVREDWSEVGSYITKYYKKNSTVVIPQLSLWGLKWYNKSYYKFCGMPQEITLGELFALCNLDDSDHAWLILKKKDIKNYISYYRHKGRLFRIVQEEEFVVKKNNRPVTLYSIEKVKE